MIVNATACLVLELRAKTKEKKQDGFMMGRAGMSGQKPSVSSFLASSLMDMLSSARSLLFSFVHVGPLILVLNLCFAETPGVMDEDMLGTCGAVDFGGWQVGRRDELWKKWKTKRGGSCGWSCFLCCWKRRRWAREN